MTKMHFWQRLGTVIWASVVLCLFFILLPSVAWGVGTPSFIQDRVVLWEPVEGAENYQVYISEQLNGREAYNRGFIRGNYLVIPEGTLQLGTQYQISVRAFDRNGVASNWSNYRSYSLENGVGDQVEDNVASVRGQTPILGGVDRNYNNTGFVRLSWRELDGADHYYVSIQNDRFRGDIIVQDNVRGTSLVLDERLEEGLYNWKIIAYNADKSVSSRWSNEAQFRIEAGQGQLQAPELVAPEGGIRTTQPVFRWNAVNGANRYSVYYKQVGAQQYTFRGNTSQTQLTSFVLEPGDYLWKVQATGANGQAMVSQEIAFSVLIDAQFNNRGRVTLRNPEGATMSTDTTIFSWNEYSGAQSYSLRTVRSGRPLIEEGTSVNVGGTSHRMRLEPGWYSWGVRANGPNDQASQWSVLKDFSVPPKPNGPEGNVERRPTITWDAVRGAQDYFLYIEQVEPNRRAILQDQWVGGTQYTLRRDLDPGRYYAVIKARNELGIETEYGGFYSFEVGGGNNAQADAEFNPQAQITAVAPLGNAVENQLFDWEDVPGARSYDIWIAQEVAGTREVRHWQYNIASSQYQIPQALNTGEEYLWWVKANGQNGQQTPWRQMENFVVGGNNDQAEDEEVGNALFDPEVEVGGLSAQPSADGSVALSWNEVAGATVYQYYIFQRQPYVQRVVGSVNGDRYQHEGLAPGDYVWFVRSGGFVNGEIASSAWVQGEFTIPEENVEQREQEDNDVFDPNTNSLSNPSPQGLAQVDSLPAFSWGAIAGAQSYEIWIADVQAMVLHQRNIQDARFQTVDTFDAGTYRWWIRASGPNNTQTDWIYAGNFRVEVEVQAEEVLGEFDINSSATGHNAEVQDGDAVFLTWDEVENAEGYQVYISNAQTYELVTMQSVEHNRFRMTGLDAGTYMWYVRGYQGNETGRWAVGSNFTIEGEAAQAVALRPPQIIAPRGQLNSAWPTFEWTAVDGADHYELWADDLTTNQGHVLREQNIRSNSFRLNVPMVPGHRYRWFVWAVDAQGNQSEWSEVEFTAGQL